LLINNTIDSIDKVTKLFYQQKREEAYDQLDSMLVSLIKTTDILGKNKEIHDYNENEINIGLTKAMRAMEDKDYILLSDILRYEIMEILKKVAKSYE